MSAPRLSEKLLIVLPSAYAAMPPKANVQCPAELSLFPAFVPVMAAVILSEQLSIVVLYIAPNKPPTKTPLFFAPLITSSASEMFILRFFTVAPLAELASVPVNDKSPTCLK